MTENKIPLVLYSGCATPAANLTPDIKFFPERLTTNRVFPEITENFLFADKISLSNTQNDIRTHFFNLFDANGREIFGISAVFNLPFEYQNEEMYADCSAFVLLSEPIFYKIEPVLIYFIKRVKSIEELFLAVEEFYSRVAIHTFELPAEIDYAIEEEGDKLRLDPIATKGQTPFTTKGLLLRKLSAEYVCDLIEATLEERTLIFTGSTLNFINQSIFDLLMLIYPFTWPFLLFSTLPAKYLGVIHEPIPGIYGIELEFLEAAPVPVDCLILNTDNFELHEANTFGKLGIQEIRTAIPRKALDILKQDFVEFNNKESEVQKLENTFNFDASDCSFEPDNFYYEIKKNESGMFFKKNRKQVTIEKKKFIKIPSEEEKAQNHVYRLIPSSFNYETIAYNIERNSRLFEFDEFSEVRQSMSPATGEQKPLKSARGRSKSKSSPGDSYWYNKPRLPEIIRGLIVQAVQQNTQLSEEAHDEPQQVIVPHPYALLLEQYISEREQLVLGMAERGERVELVENTVKQLQKFDIEKCQRSQIVKELEVENSPMSVLVRVNDKISLPDTENESGKAFVHVEKIKIGICAALLSLVGHYKRSLLLEHKKVGADQEDTTKSQEKNKITTFDIIIKQIDPSTDYFNAAEFKNFFTDIEYENEYCRFPYLLLFDPLTFVAESPADFHLFNAYFVNSEIFEAFLESRVSADCCIQGYCFNAYDDGHFYAQNISFFKQRHLDGNSNPNSMQISNYTENLTIKSQDTSAYTEDSAPDEPSSILNVSVEARSIYDYQPPLLDDLTDYADLLLKFDYQELERETNPHYEFKIMKQSGGDSLKWQERTLHVDISEAEISLKWYDKKTEKGEMIAMPDEFAPFVETHSDWPTPYAVCVYGTIKKKGENRNRVLALCMMNYEDERKLLYIIRRKDCSGRVRLSEQSEGALQLIRNSRKCRRYALGNFYRELCKEGVTDEFITRIYQSLDERESKK